MNIFQDSDPSMTGLEQLRTLIGAHDPPPIFETLGFALTEVHDGRVVLTGRASPKVYNPIGSVHGGFAAAMLDSACGCAVHSRLAANQAYTTLELKISYHRPLSVEAGPVRAEGTLLTIGRRVGFSEAKITDADGRLYASASSTCLIFERGR